MKTALFPALFFHLHRLSVSAMTEIPAATVLESTSESNELPPLNCECRSLVHSGSLHCNLLCMIPGSLCVPNKASGNIVHLSQSSQHAFLRSTRCYGLRYLAKKLTIIQLFLNFNEPAQAPTNYCALFKHHWIFLFPGNIHYRDIQLKVE